MARCLLLLLASLVGGATALRVNGWFPCTPTAPIDGDFSTLLLFSGVQFECAKIQVPLCHDGICESSRTTEVFVKRKLAGVRPAAKTVWFLEGGPGASSTNMEFMMAIMANLLDDTINVYTMDHRGTGRSGFLQCEAAQAMAEGSPGGANLELGELADCERDVLFEIDGHTAAYSVTSAARDVAVLLEYLEDVAEQPGEDSKVYLYGVSYGTYLVERVMHLAPPQVRGYIVDGVLSETGFSAVDWNKNIMPPTQRFLEACYDSPKCPLQFKSRHSVVKEVLAMYEQIDAQADDNACVDGLSFVGPGLSPSDALRGMFSLLVRDITWRELIPSLLLRIHRCNDTDYQELQFALFAIQKQFEERYGGAASSAQAAQPVWILDESKRRQFLDVSPTNIPSTMLYFLITFSELWQLPMPDWDTLNEDFANGPFSLDPETVPAYCLLSGGFNKDSDVRTCNQLRQVLEEIDPDTALNLPTITEPFLYDHDQFWNTTATLGDDVGVLLVVGGLDFQTPSELGRREYHELKSKNKLLVEFTFGAHGAGFLPTTPEDHSRCGPSILASFIANDADITKVNTTCLESLPDLEFNDQGFQNMLQEVQTFLVDNGEMAEQSGSGTGSA